MDNVRIDDKLNLVIPVERSNGLTYWVHSTPISAEIFADFYVPIGQVFNKIYTGGIGMVAGPRVAYFALRDICMQSNTWEGPNGVENTLCNEVWRLTNVLMPGERGWNMMTLSDVMRREMISPREIQEVKNNLIFFTVNFCMHTQAVMRIIMDVSQQTLGARVTPLTCTEFKNSSAISIEGESSGEIAKV